MDPSWLLCRPIRLSAWHGRRRGFHRPSRTSRARRWCRRRGCRGRGRSPRCGPPRGALGSVNRPCGGFGVVRDHGLLAEGALCARRRRFLVFARQRPGALQAEHLAQAVDLAPYHGLGPGIVAVSGVRLRVLGQRRECGARVGAGEPAPRHRTASCPSAAVLRWGRPYDAALITLRSDKGHIVLMR